MSEAKRVPLQTLEFPESLGHAAKKEKKGEKGKQLAPSFRFTLALPESNEKTCPEFNYSQLLKAAEKKRRKEQKNSENTTNGLLPFDDDDDEDILRDMARRFETKYGTATMGRKRNKYDDYVDLGAGYDENDSFIDNTDAYDEIVPEEYTTAHGGFYINCGPLEFKTADRHTLVHNNNNNNDNNNDDEESNECSDDDTEGGGDSPKRADKRILSSSDDDETTEDITGDQARKKQKIDENGEKKSHHNNMIKKKKKQQNHAQDQQDGDMLQRRKEKNETTDADGGTASEDQDEKKRADKDTQKSSKIVSEKKFDIKKFEKKSSNGSNGLDAKKVDLKKFPAGKDSNIDDAIETVVNAARQEDESSRDTTDSGKSRGIIATESECDDIDKEEAPLPESLPEDVKEIVNKIKHHTENSKEAKGKFFNTSVNTALFSLEKKLRMLNSPSVRLQTYGHLARFMPCSKSTLLNRAKKLYLQDAEYRVREPMQRLKTIIDNVMPSVTDRYIKECEKVANEKGLENSPVDRESSEDEDGSNKSLDKSKIPKRRFPWTEGTKKIVLEIANARRQYFKILRPRKESMESFVASFMETKVLPLWPPGCVRLQTLLKYSNPVEPIIKKKTKKLKDICGTNSISTSGNSVCNSTGKLECTSVNNAAMNQEQEKPINSSKSTTSNENATNLTNLSNLTNLTSQTSKTDSIVEKKQAQLPLKHKENTNATQQENSSMNSTTVGKISVVPTSQLMAQKPNKTHIEKFNVMELTNSSLSITPVNDYHKPSVKSNETKKDVVSITAYTEPSTIVASNSNETVQSTVHLSVHRQESSTYAQHSNYQITNQTSPHSKSALKHIMLQDNEIMQQSEKKIEEKDGSSIDTSNKTEKKEKRRDRIDGKHKTNDAKKRKKDGTKIMEQQSIGSVKNEVVVPIAQYTLTKEEQEQRQIEETVAATNILSQIINEDSSGRSVTDKRKDGLSIDDPVGNSVQPTEHEKNVQMVMRSLKELQELQEMKYSPSHSPVGSGIQKPGNSNAPYVSYQDDYRRFYLKKEEKLRTKEEAQW